MSQLTTLNGNEFATSINRGLANGSESPSPLVTKHSPSEPAVTSNGENAKKLMKMTSGIRLANRSTGNWHHCGLNE